MIFMIIVMVRLVIIVMLVIKNRMKVFFLLIFWIMWNEVYLKVVIIIINIIFIKVVKGIILISGVVNNINLSKINVVVILESWLWLFELILIMFCLIMV